MESKLNIEVLRNYSVAFTKGILDQCYGKKDFLNGDDILSLTSIKQVNLFVVYQLLLNWKGEMDRLKSPYFDYKEKEVKKALKELVNILSRHIKVDRKHLDPLAEKAVEDTLLLILSPYDFYCSYISNWDNSRIKLKELKTFARYIKINHNLMGSFISRLETEGKKELFIEDGLRIINEVFEETNQTPEEIEPFIKDFSTVKSLDISSIYGENSTEGEPESKAKLVSDEDEVSTLNDQLAEKEEKTTLAESHSKKRIDNIKSNLTINQKFMFVNQLFDGNVDDFNKVIDFLDNCSNQADAMDFINKNYLKKSNWVKDSTEVKEFIEVIAKKYA